MTPDYPPDARTLLLVEDDEDHAEVVRRSLQRLQEQGELVEEWRLVHLSEASEAVSYLTAACNGQNEHKVPDLILLDWRFRDQEIQGSDVLRRLKQHEDALSLKLHLLPIVVLTSSDDRRDIAEAFSAYANSYLVKPRPGRQEEWPSLIKEVLHYWHHRDLHDRVKPRPARTTV